MYGDVWKWAGEFRRSEKKHWNKLDSYWNRTMNLTG